MLDAAVSSALHRCVRVRLLQKTFQLRVLGSTPSGHMVTQARPFDSRSQSSKL